MEFRASKLGVSEDILFAGYLNTNELLQLYDQADVFVSTLTGTSLREAGLKRLPIVAYEVDWQKDLLVHEVTALFAPVNNPVKLAEQVSRLFKNTKLKKHISDNFYNEATTRWNRNNIKDSLIKIFQ